MTKQRIQKSLDETTDFVQRQKLLKELWNWERERGDKKPGVGGRASALDDTACQTQSCEAGVASTPFS